MKIDLEMLERLVATGATGATVLALVRLEVERHEAKRAHRRPVEVKSKRKKRGGTMVDRGGHEVDGGVSTDDWPDDFGDQFWQAYPRKTEKLAAMKKLASLRKSRIVTFADLIAGVQRYAAAMAQAEMQFIKGPAAWLNAGRWSDDAAALVRSTAPRGAQGFESLFQQTETPDAASPEYDLDIQAN